MYKQSILAAAVLAAAFGAQAADADYSNGGSFTENQTITVTDITGGTFSREKDGAEGVTVTIRSNAGMTISGGTFTTSNPAHYTDGVETSRGESIGLYNPNSASEGGVYSLYTEQEIRDIFAQAAEAENPSTILSEAFKTSDGYTAEELTVNDLDKVLAALHAASSLSTAQTLDGYVIEAAGDMTITGGNFNFDSANASTISADGTLVWNGGTLTSQGGGGAVEIRGAEGLEILSGSISSYGSQNGISDAYGFDYRGDINRNRWTLGKYLGLRSNGDIIIGSDEGTGPDIYVRDGMLAFYADSGVTEKGSIYLRGGSVTLHGVTRSTLTSAWDYGDANTLTSAVMTGGELNVITDDELYASPTDNASMWTIALDMRGGEINLYNSQINSASTYSGGVINLEGYSSLSGSVTITGDTVVNLGTHSAIGAIPGEAKGYAANATSINISGGTFNFAVTAPAEGNTLVKGTNIAGITGKSTHSFRNGTNSDAVASINISGVKDVNFLTGELAAGTYVVDDFIETQSVAVDASNDANGTGYIVEAGDITLGGSFSKETLFYKAVLGEKTGSAEEGYKVGLNLEVKDSTTAVASLTGESYLAKNARAFSAIAATGSGIAAARIAEIWQIADTDDAATNAAVRNDLRDITNPGSAAGMFGQKNAADTIGAEVFEQASLATSTLDNVTGKRIWGTAVGDWGRVNSESDFDIDTTGVVFGADHTFDQSVRAGFAFGALHTKSDGEGSKFTGDSYWIGMYGSWKLPTSFPLVLDADALYGWTDGDINTSLLGRSGSTDVDGDVIRVSAHASMPFELSVASVVPYLGLEWTRVSQDGYNDRDLGRSVDSLDEDALTMPIGIKFVKSFKNDSAVFKGTMDIAYARDLTDFDPRLTTTYGGIGIDSESADIGKDAFRFGLGVDCHLNEAWTIGVKYKLEARDGYTDNQVRGSVAYLW